VYSVVIARAISAEKNDAYLNTVNANIFGKAILYFLLRPTTASFQLKLLQKLFSYLFRGIVVDMVSRNSAEKMRREITALKLGLEWQFGSFDVLSSDGSDQVRLFRSGLVRFGSESVFSHFVAVSSTTTRMPWRQRVNKCQGDQMFLVRKKINLRLPKSTPQKKPKPYFFSVKSSHKKISFLDFRNAQGFQKITRMVKIRPIWSP
jgi:hypothetical protein